MKQIAERVLSWCSEPEENAIQQALNIAKHPYLIGNVCLMPDTHSGYGMPIGGVVALEDAVCPNMVGVDIGCGMLAVKTSLTDIDTEKLKQILSLIRNTVPVGFNHHTQDQESPVFELAEWQKLNICSKQYHAAKRQIGTLGGGNHFIEIQKGDDNHIWFMIHSGSRNLGKQVAEYYNEKAEKLCKMWKHDEIVKNELAFLPKGTPEFHEYLAEMRLCLQFSNANRDLMAQRIEDAFKTVMPDVTFDDRINIQHNYVVMESHFGKNVWVHRKGATLARKGTQGIIPGSQGTCSYIVQGKGNPESLCSCSHGAGRKMSRKQAREELSVEKEQELMNQQGILHAIRGVDDLDEAPSAYKDIDIVMLEQEDLVDIVVKLQPLAVIKA